MKDIINNRQPLLKCSGSKRKQAPEIVDMFPKEINTYYECFLGGGSVLHELLNRIYNGEITCKKIICSDINSDLMGVWNMFKNNRKELFDFYVKEHTNIIEQGDFENTPEDEERTKKMAAYYYANRTKFNSLDLNTNERIKLFFWITRTCFNGLIRYNPSGKFNASFHVAGSGGVKPAELLHVFDAWGKVIDNVDIEFVCDDYKEVIKNASEGDVIYMDPPYENNEGRYLTNIFSFDAQELFNVIQDLSSKNVKVLLSYDGKSGKDDNTSKAIPENLFKQHLYINSGHSSFKRLKSKSVGTGAYDMVKDSLYLNF